MDWRYRPWPAGLVKDRIPVNPCGRSGFQVAENDVAPHIPVIKLVDWEFLILWVASLVGIAEFIHPELQIRISLLQLSNLGVILEIVAVIGHHGNELPRFWIVQHTGIPLVGYLAFRGFAHHELRRQSGLLQRGSNVIPQEDLNLRILDLRVDLLGLVKQAQIIDYDSLLLVLFQGAQY